MLKLATRDLSLMMDLATGPNEETTWLDDDVSKQARQREQDSFNREQGLACTAGHVDVDANQRRLPRRGQLQAQSCANVTR